MNFRYSTFSLHCCWIP